MINDTAGSIQSDGACQNASWTTWRYLSLKKSRNRESVRSQTPKAIIDVPTS